MYLNFTRFCILPCLYMCLFGCMNILCAQIRHVPVGESPCRYRYIHYASYEHTGRIIVYFSADSGLTCYVWEDGFVAWKESKSEKEFFTTQLDTKQIRYLIQKIKDNYEQGARKLGGERRTGAGVRTYHGNHLTLQIADDEFFQTDFWSENTTLYYEMHGATAINVNIDNYSRTRNFGILHGVEQFYAPKDKQWQELTQNDISLMILKFKEDIDHLLFCRELIYSLLPKDRDACEAIELRMKNVDVKIALRYGERISEYRYVYTDEKDDSGYAATRLSVLDSTMSPVRRLFLPSKMDVN